MTEGRRYKVGINRNIIGKPSGASSVNQATGWQNVELTKADFIEAVKHGFAFSAHFQHGYRKTLNFICSDVVAADIDGGMTAEEAIKQPFVRDYASFIYTTPSHTAQRHRFRVVFLLDDTIKNAADWADCLYGLALKLGSDPSIKDSGRLFYGNPKAKVLRLRGSLPSVEAAQLIAVGNHQRHLKRSPQGGNQPTVSPHRLTSETVVRLANGDFVKAKDLQPRMSVFCPFHLDAKHSAFVVRSRRRTIGIHCMACNASFWSESPPEYDFNAFDRLVEERNVIDAGRLEEHLASDDFFEQFFPPLPSITVLQKRYLPSLKYAPGITLVKSPKGTGKTEALKSLIDQVKEGKFQQSLKRKEYPKSILLVGHRQSLIKEAAKKLKLNCYIDNGEEEIAYNGYATSLDSLFKIMEPRFIATGIYENKSIPAEIFDLLILDESEQVFSHLTAETLAKNRGTLRAHYALSRAIRTAKAVVALDADLGLITAQALKAMRPTDWENGTRIIFNKPVEVSTRRVLHQYQSRKDLEKLLVAAVQDGKRCFVVSNSKGAVDTLEQMIRDQCGNGIAMRKITSENSRNPDERDFVGNITEEYLKIQVLLCSPSLGTGIDITFPKGQQEVDHVFGFFYPFVNTHMDVDQQLARVRNPGAVSVWFDPSRYSYETNFDVIRDDLARGHWVENAITGYDDNGQVTYDEEHPLLLIMTHIVCSRRASQNRFVELFHGLRSANGWDVEVIKRLDPKAQRKKAQSHWDEAAKRVKSREVVGILAAEDLEDEDVIELYEMRRRGEALTEKQLFQLKRGDLRMSFNCPISPELVDLASDGRLKERVKTYLAMVDQFAPSTLTPLLKKLRDAGGGAKVGKIHKGLLLYLIGALVGLFDDRGRLSDHALKKADFNSFVMFCDKNRISMEEIFQLQLRGDIAENPVRQFNELFKLSGVRLKKNSRRRHGGVGKFDYVVDAASVALMDDLSKNFRDFELVARSSE